jgi:hypothetical protein
MQPRKLICIFSFLLSSQYVSVLAGHHQVLLFMLKLSNCIAYHFYLVLLSTKLHYGRIIFIKIVLFKIFGSNIHHMKKTTPTRWWRKRRTAGANVTKTAGRVEHSHNKTTAGHYNINKKGMTRVEAVLNTSIVTLRVVGGDEMGSLKTETLKYGCEAQGTRTRERLGWQGPVAYTKDKPIVSSERAPHENRTVTVKQ